MLYDALSREEIVSVIDGKGAASRVPILLNFWVNPETFGEREQAVREIMGQYPQDAEILNPVQPMVFDAPDDDPDYRWTNLDNPYTDDTAALDQRIAIKDWGQLDEVLELFPNPHYKGMFVNSSAPDGRYRLAAWWYCFFERHWDLRGMTNALMDYYTNPDQVHRLYRACTDFYLVYIERAKREINADGILVSDDLGTQTGPFFSPAIFDEFFKPYYTELIEKAHSLGMHFWLHACGCIEPFLGRFVEMGLDVIHPIQKYTMDEKVIAEKYGKDLCIWAGFDVQQVIPWGTVEDVRREVQFVIDTYYRPEGKLLFTAGNGVNGDCPVESLAALYDEAFRYGTEKVKSCKER